MCDRIADLQRLTRTFFQVSCLIACFPAHADEIDEIVVTAVRRAVAEDQLSISLDTVERDQVARNVLLTDALRDAPGVFLQQTTPGQGAAIVRGQKGSAVLHLVDGMRLNNAIFRSAPTQYLALVPVAAIESVEVLRGTPTSLYGNDAVAGVVQLVTRTPRFDSDELQARGEIVAAVDSAELERSLRATVDAGNMDFSASLSTGCSWRERGGLPAADGHRRGRKGGDQGRRRNTCRGKSGRDPRRGKGGQRDRRRSGRLETRLRSRRSGTSSAAACRASR